MSYRTGSKLHPVEKVDLAAADAVKAEPRSTAGRLLCEFAEWGDQPPMIAACAGVFATGLARRDRKMVRTSLRMLAAHGLATAFKSIVKNRIDRTRPKVANGKTDYRMEQGTSRDGRLRSMPSGHSAGLAAVAAAVAREYPQAGPPVALAAGSIAAAQLPSENHFLSDVLAGIAIGLVAESAVALVLSTAAGPDSED